MRVSELFLARAKIRDKIIFFLFALTCTVFFQLTVLDQLWLEFASFTFLILLFLQFYFAAFFQLPFRDPKVRIACYIPIFAFNYLIFRELAHGLLPLQVRSGIFFEPILAILFVLVLLGRNIKAYISLIYNLERLNALRLQNQLFTKPAKVTLNFGNEGELTVHPNEIVYIRTKAAGDHTKIFGLKRRKEPQGQKKLVEYSTTSYQNFNEIFKLVAGFPQLKRISQSTVFNFLYPYEERNGTLIVESRRFAISSRYKPN